MKARIINTQCTMVKGIGHFKFLFLILFYIIHSYSQLNTSQTRRCEDKNLTSEIALSFEVCWRYTHSQLKHVKLAEFWEQFQSQTWELFLIWRVVVMAQTWGRKNRPIQVFALLTTMYVQICGFKNGHFNIV